MADGGFGMDPSQGEWNPQTGRIEKPADKIWDAQKKMWMPKDFATQMGDEDFKNFMQQTTGIQQQNKALQDQVAAMEKLKNSGPDMKHNPISEKDGKISLRDEFKLSDGQSLVDKLLSQQKGNEQFAKDDATASSQQGLAQAMSNMAMRGGAKAGNNLILQKQGLKDLLLAQQGVARQGMTERMGIGVKGAELGRQAEGTNLQNLLTASEKVNQWDLEKYKQNMAVKAAETQAAATRAAGDGGKK